MNEAGKETPTRQGHSALGMAALLISAAMWIALISLILYSRAQAAANPDLFENDIGASVALGVYALLCMLGQLIALGLAVAGLVQKQRKRILAVIGLVLVSCYLVLAMMVGLG